MRILIIGPQGSGKGTIGKLLSQNLEMPLVEVGKILRHLPETHYFKDDIENSMQEGDLAPNDEVAYVIKQELSKVEYESGFIMEGWARQLSDLEEFDPEFNYVIYLDIPRQTSIERISNRVVCEKSGHTYNLKYLPPKNAGICDVDGSKLITREDDEPEAINARLNIFETRTRKVLDYFKGLEELSKTKILKVDASKLPPEILKEILSKLYEAEKNRNQNI